MHSPTANHFWAPGKSSQELARILGGAKITDAVLENAREMKELAQAAK